MAREAFELVKAALRHPLEVSTIFPTSRALAQTFLNFSNMGDGNLTVVELGVGSGAITKPLRPRLGPKATYLGIELDGPVVEFMRRTYPDMHFEQGRAEEMQKWVQPESADRVLSSLPWTLFNPEMQKQTLKSIKQAMKPDGLFVTYMCANARWYPNAKSFLRLLNEEFAMVERSELEWMNMPPAHVFRASKTAVKP